MADVKWIKLTTDMFDNRKIKHLRRLPDGNNIVLLWVMLLTMAGRCNAGGMIFLTENIPYTTKMLADELDFEETTVELGIQALDQLNMIVSKNGFFSIAGWEEYQNADRLAELRAKDRERKRLKRADAKALLEDSTECPRNFRGTSTDCPHTDIDKDLDIDKEKDLSITTPPAPKKHKHGEHQNVLLTDEEYAKLQERFPNDYEAKIETFSEAIARKGYKYKSHYLAILDWARRDEKKATKQTASTNPFLDLLKG
jgi:predicted phage replisome organizer